jgi:ent-kaurenoic acid hydroxylase
MFGKPSVIVTIPETCKQALMNDEAFKYGWPPQTVELIGKKSFIGISDEERKRLRRLTAAPINGHEALTVYIKYIEENVISALENWAEMKQIELLTELRVLTFKIIMYIFLSSESSDVMESMEKYYTELNYGLRAMAINIPGFAYHRALKARTKLVAILQSVVDERRIQKKNNIPRERTDMLDSLIDVEDENGRKLSNEEIIDLLIMYLNAGHESSGHTMMWAAVLLQRHPEIFQKAKEEQENVVKKRPPGQKGLTLKEVRGMNYLNKVIDETLRYVSFSLMVFREAKKDVEINGYAVPKGWKVIVWFKSVHYDPETYKNPKEFNPSRWDDFTPKAGAFLPFGAGSRLCPGNDLSKLEIAIFLHHFLLNYELEQFNPNGQQLNLPHPRPVDNCLGRIKKTTSAPVS